MLVDSAAECFLEVAVGAWAAVDALVGCEVEEVGLEVVEKDWEVDEVDVELEVEEVEEGLSAMRALSLLTL